MTAATSQDAIARAIAGWQGRIAKAAMDGGGLDVFKAALEYVKKEVPPDRALQENAKAEIWGTAEHHLAEIHGAQLLEDIYRTVFPEDAANNDELDEDVLRRDAANETKSKVERLAKLSPIEYERARKSAAAELGIDRLASLDAAVKSARAENSGTKGQGRAIELPEIKPWPDPVDGAELLENFVATIKKYVVVTDATAIAVALWCVATHIFDVFSIFPRLTLRSATPRCGKTTLRDVIAGLVSRPLSADSILAAALFRTIEAARPTLLLDEADTYLPDNEDLRGIVNSGHRRDGCVIRCVGDEHEPRQFSTWAPVLLALIGKPPATIYDRSIIVTLQRKTPKQSVVRYRFNDRERLRPLAQKAARWVKDHAGKLAQAEPAALDFLNDRANDNWLPLLAIADFAGGDWRQRARAAARELADGAANDAATSMGERLLADIRWVFDGKTEERNGQTVAEYDPLDHISSADLVDHLAKIEGRPWAEWKASKPISQNALARQLQPFGVYPGTIRLDGAKTLKGYKRASFKDVFERYPSFQTVTASQANNDGHGDALQTVTSHIDVTVPKSQERNNDAPCDGVTVGEPLYRDVDDADVLAEEETII